MDDTLASDTPGKASGALNEGRVAWEQQGPAPPSSTRSGDINFEHLFPDTENKPIL